MAGSALLYGVWVRTTGNRPVAGRPSRAGRMTSARRTTPSDIVIGTSRSMTVPYVAGRAVHWPVDLATVRGGPTAAGYARDVDRVGATVPACVGAVEVKACARPSASCGVACTANDAGGHRGADPVYVPGVPGRRGAAAHGCGVHRPVVGATRYV